MYVKFVAIVANCVGKARSATYQLYARLTLPELEDESWDFYPIAIIQSRYSGVYEGGKWMCIQRFNPFDADYDGYAHGDDCDAIDFMNSHVGQLIGRGKTPHKALLDMKRRARAAER